MATQTAGRVFRLAERFVRSSGTAVRILFPPKSDSVGLLRLSTAALSLWITEDLQTAKRIDWPPDRRNDHRADRSSPQTTLQIMFSEVPPQRTPEWQRNQSPTALPEQLNQHRTPYEPDNTWKGRTQMQTELHDAALSNTATKLATHNSTTPRNRSNSDRCLNKPLSPPPLTQNEGCQTCVN